MDNKTTQLDFKLLVDQSVSVLDNLNAALQCDAIQFLLQTLKCKYPDACDLVVRNLFSHISSVSDTSSTQIANIKQFHLLHDANTKKEKVETEAPHLKQENDLDAASTDLNQNFEKILCKEEFMCLDEEDDFPEDDVDTENSSSLSKRLRYGIATIRSNNTSGTTTGIHTSDPLDLIYPGATINIGSCLVKRKFRESFGVDEDDESNSYDERMENQLKTIASKNLTKRKRPKDLHKHIIGNNALIKVSLERSSLGDGYVFHEDNEYTMRYHHSSGEFNERAYKAQFRALLKLAMKQSNKPILKKFYENFVITGQLLGTTPSAQVLKELREQRLKEWTQQRAQRQLASQTTPTSGSTPLCYRNKQECQLPAISFGESELESETESQLSSAAQEIMKFEEFIDEGTGAGRLIDGLEMEPEIDDITAAGSNAIDSGSGSGNSNSSSNGVNNNGIAIAILESDGITIGSEGHHHQISTSLVTNGLISSNINNNESSIMVPISSHGSQNPEGLTCMAKELITHHTPIVENNISSSPSNEVELGTTQLPTVSNETQEQHQNHFNSSNNPLSMMGDMMEHRGALALQQPLQRNHTELQQNTVSSLSNRNPLHGNTVHLPPIPNLDSDINAVGVSRQLSSSLEIDDNDLSPDEDDDDMENDIDDLDAAKQQLIDGGSSSSTSLQAPPSLQSGSSTIGSKKDKPNYNCLLCPKSYRKRKSLLDHYKMHPGYCHDCGQPNGTSLEEIIHHNRTMHVNEFPFVCETCGESYSRRQQFHAHVESHNKKELKTFPCGECGMKFPQKKLQQHFEETGHKADGAICEVCGAEFPSKNALYQHIIRVHKRDNFFECHICHNRFTLKANLERHVQLHKEIKRTYVCDLCGSSYFTYPALKEHYSNAHVDVSECKCKLCGKRFGSAKSLQRHLPSHSEERPHCCNYCDETFKWKTHLVRHKQTVHGNEPPPKKSKQRFPKVDEEIQPVLDMPGPPPVKGTKKPNVSKTKHQLITSTQQQLQSSSQKGVGATATPPPPVSTTPSSSQQDQFNAAMVSSNSSQSSTASTSQHSVSTSESQPNSMYNQNFSSDKLINQHQQQSQPSQFNTSQQQQQHAIHQQHATPPPPPPQQQPQQTLQQPLHRHTPNNTTTELHMQRLNTFSGQESQFHFEGNSNTTYQQQQLINQYQQHHLSQAQQQQHLRSHTPQSPHPQQIQQHFSSPQPHHISQMHHQHQLMQHQLQQQQRHNQQPSRRSPLLNHQTQQLQQQHQQSSHSPQHGSLQSPQPSSSSSSTQQQQYIQQQPADAWGNINFSAASNSQSQQQHLLKPNELKDNSNKFYIVDSADFLGLPMNVGNIPSTSQQQHQSVTKPQQSQQQQETPMSGELMNFQHMWPQSQGFGNVGQAPPHQQPQQQQQPQSQASQSSTADAHNYNNIGSILTNLIDSNSTPMEYNYDMLSSQQTPQQQPVQQQQHPSAAYTSGLMRNPNTANVYGNTTYEQQQHHTSGASHHNTMGEQLVNEQQKNSFQPYHPLQQPTLTNTHHLHSLTSTTHLLPPSSSHGNIYEHDRAAPPVGYSMLGNESKPVLPPINDYMHHMQQQQLPSHAQQPDLIYYPVKND